jgi:predicted ArsR family transcriptional regulator
MKPKPKPKTLSDRICDALMLQPMTVEQLATCLSIHPMTVRKHVRAMRDDGDLVGVDIVKTRYGRPWIQYSLPARTAA